MAELFRTTTRARTRQVTAEDGTIADREVLKMDTVTLRDAQTNLADLIHRLNPGEDLVIKENDRPVATLVAAPKPRREPRRLGTMRGTVLSMEHFDDPLEEFEEYM